MLVIGIDEVGRGPLAGPVVVTALALPEGYDLTSSGLPLRDSKKLTERQREAWRTWVTVRPDITYATAFVYPKTIDRLNISGAANLAAHRAYSKLLILLKLQTANHNLKTVILDGGLHLPKTVPHRTIVKADEKYPAVSLASIMAKCARDRAMRRMDRRYPTYGFAAHKGYGTEAHVKALKRHGPAPEHRLTFIRNFRIL